MDNEKFNLTPDNQCPECGTAILTGAVKCPCGWVKSGKAKAKTSKPFPYPLQICCWQNNQNRCPLPSSAPTGSKYYCKFHSQNQYHGHKGLEIWNEMDNAMEGRANQFHEQTVGMIRSAMFWKDNGQVGIDHDELIRKRSALPPWMLQCQQVIMKTILSPMEQFSRGMITAKEFDKQNNNSAE